MDKKNPLYIALSRIADNELLDDSVIFSLSKDEMELVKEIQDAGLATEARELMDSVDLQENWEILKDRLEIGEYGGEKLGNFRYPQIFKYAAVFVGFFLVGSAVYFWQRSSINVDSVLETGKNDIILTQVDGSRKVLSEEETMDISLLDKNGNEIGVQKGKVLDYSGYDGKKNDELIYNELTVPYGKRFDIILSDGTQVSLNAGTHMKYPVAFSHTGKREVSITGEAYFKVKKDSSRPFRVTIEDNFNIEVLGTEFNVSTYADGGDVQTVLVEGSVALYENTREKQKQLLTPGHKAEWNKINGDVAISPANLRLHVGWLKGELIFKNAPLSAIVPKLERSYDVEIQYDPRKFEGKRYDASFHVDIETIGEVVHHLSKVAPISYQIQGRTIILDNLDKL